ncbi:MAG TPA: ATP-binding protein [Pyrinomonadaceae bacterium]
MTPDDIAQPDTRPRRILGRLAPEHFMGRGEELRALVELAAPAQERRGVLVLAAPAAGASELLRQAYDRLFQQRGGAAPVYFAWSRQERTAAAAARRFLHTFLTQLVAHRRDDPALVHAPPPLRDLLDLAAPQDYEWIERLTDAFERARDGDDERALVRLCLSAPQTAAVRGARTVVLLDDVPQVEHLAGDLDLGAEIAQAATHADVPFVLAGLRRRLLDVLNGEQSPYRFDGFTTRRVEQLAAADARALVERLAFAQHVLFGDETRDLIVQQFGGSPFYLALFVHAARREGVALTSFRACQQLYVDELFGGRIQRRLNAVLEEIAPEPSVRRALVRLLHESGQSGGRSPAEAWRKRLDVDADELYRILTGLHGHELASFNGTYVELGQSTVWRDYLRASYRLQIAAEPRALVVAETLVETLKRAPQTMARHYRRESALRLGELMRGFDFQRVPESLLRYDRFARSYRGRPLEEVREGLAVEGGEVQLPQIVHAASAASFHPPIAQLCDEERCAVAHGFESGGYAEAGEVVWLAVEVESKLEAGRALAELWLERLEQLAQACGFERVRYWLVSREGFSPDAAELLNERDAYGSSREQLEHLTALLADGGGAGGADADEFAIELPMSEDTELIAAHTVEQIARRMEFQPEAINQNKTALVEACINAAEHSLSTERKIYNRFRVEGDKLVITVSSRGLAAPVTLPENGSADKNGNGGESAKGRRGWGLKLIRTLMDDVEFERVDDGTRLRMTKYLRK